MKTIVAAIIFGLALSVSAVQADDNHHPVKGAGTDAPADQGMGVMNMEQMQKHVSEMQQLMKRFHDTDDAKERQQLMQEHMDMMQEMMGKMHGMVGQGMMQDGSPVSKKGAGMMGDMSMEQRQQMTENRMDMMQGMMRQMMDQMMMQQSTGRTGK